MTNYYICVAHLEQSDSVKRQTGAFHTDLADVLAELGRYAEARAEYEASLQIKREIDDARGEAVVLGQLGTLALRQRDYAEARRHYAEALETFQTLGEPESEAILWHQLGMVAADLRDWDEAERCYRESLRLREVGNNLTGVAETANQLGTVCQQAGRPAEAETWYRRALDAFHTLGHQRYKAVCVNNLAALMLDVEALPPAARPAPFADRDLLAEAEAHARRAAEIKEQLGPSTQPWTTYNILTQIAERKGLPEEARRWRRREQESFAAFAGSSLEVQKWAEEIAVVAAACQGNKEAQQVAVQIIDRYRDNEDWGKLVATFAQMLDGERDCDVLLEGLDRTDAAIIIHTLAALAGEPVPTPTPPPSSPQASEGNQEGNPLEQVFGLVEAGCRGEQQAGQLAYGLVTQVLQASEAPPELRALGKTLQRVLGGLRGEEALVGLPAELRPPVEELLRRLG